MHQLIYVLSNVPVGREICVLIFFLKRFAFQSKKIFAVKSKAFEDVLFLQEILFFDAPH